MPKYYIMLVDLEFGQMRVPVKALWNPYNQQPAYCAGMPQFFGGTDTDDQSPAIVLDQEITQESRRTLELTSGFPRHFFTDGNMFFYWADEGQWGLTGTPWGLARDNAEAEMDRIVVVELTRFDENMGDQAIIAELLGQTGGGNAPLQGQAAFAASATRVAFIDLIRMYLARQL
ncbi:MAG: hypothetical protein OEV73_04585 [Desulfobulbaceae bacterium]|nr:hypothetical protein [Desulfobulbaceae bacterium]